MSDEFDPVEKRIQSYLKSRADVAVPRDILSRAMDQRQDLRSTRRWFSVRLGLASAAAVVIAVLVVSFGLPPHTPPASTSVPSGIASNTAQPLPSAIGDQTFPTSVMGMPVVTVEEARTMLNEGRLDGRAVAVGGYWLQGMVPSCPAPMRFTAPLEGWCGASEYLAGDDFPVSFCTDLGDGSRSCTSGPPSAPYLTPFVMSEASGSDAIGGNALPDSAPGEQNRRVVLIGHARDPRLLHCQPDVRDQCADAFVVDRVAWAAGKYIDVNPAVGYGDPPVEPSLNDVAGSSGLGDAMLDAVAIRANEVSTIDPRFHADGDGAIWLARSIRTDSGSVEDPTRAVDVSLIEDATGKVLSSTGLDMNADYKPAQLNVQATERGGDTKDQVYPFYRLGRLDGSGLLEGMVGEGRSTSNGAVSRFGPGLPAVLDPATYIVRAWRSTLNGDLSNVPQDECSDEVTLTAAEAFLLEASFPTHGACTLGPPSELPF